MTLQLILVGFLWVLNDLFDFWSYTLIGLFFLSSSTTLEDSYITPLDQWHIFYVNWRMTNLNLYNKLEINEHKSIYVGLNY